MLEETYADGGRVSNTYDLFGNRLTVKRWDTDTTGVQTRYAYDHLGHLLSTKIENKVDVAVGVSLYHSDIEVTTTQAQNLTQQFFYDELGRRVRSVDAAGMSTYSKYDLDGNVIATWINQDLQRTVTAYDAFHHRTAMRDANNRGMSWRVDSFGRVEKYTDMGNAVTTYGYDAAGNTTLTSISRGGVNSTITQTYGDGLLARIVNNESGLTTNYTYDAVGNRLTERQSYAPGADGSLGAPARVQNNTLVYDEQNRVKSVNDDQYKLTYTYDNNGNRTSTTTVYGGMPAFTKFNGYDQMNRQIAVNVDAWNDVTKVAVLGKTGHQITYDLAGNRKSDAFIGVAINASTLTTTKDAKTTESYSYDAVGRLQYTYRDGVLFDTRTYDRAGRLTRSGMVVQASDKSREATFAAGIISQKRTYAYNETGQMLRQQETNWDGLDQDVIFFSDDQTTGGYDKMGNVLGYTVTRERTDASQHGIYTIEYLWTDSAREQKVTLALNKTTTTSVYDNAGNRIKLLDQSGNVKTRFWYDADGHVQSKLETEGNISGFSLIVNGQMLGDENFKDTNVLGSAYQPVTAAALTAAPSTYSVQRETETLQGIAQSIWGDAKLWYLIADANGLSSDSVLKVGDVLRIPTRVNTVHNDYATFKPYDAAEAIGNTAPALPPPSQGGGGCGGVGMLIMVVVAVVVTLFTAGAMTGPVVGLMSTMAAGASAIASGGFIVGGALAAAAGSIASQAVGIAIGAQDSFSWKGVALAAIGGGISGGLPANIGGFSNVYAQAAARAVVSNVASQGVGIVAGLQNGFEWRNVAASAAGAVAGQALSGSTILGSSELAQRTVSGFAADTAASLMRGGKIDVVRIATDAFGNALGSSLANANWGGGGDQSAGDTTAGQGQKIYKNGTTLPDSELFGGETNWLRKMGISNYAVPNTPADTGTWGQTLAQWREDNPTYIPQVSVQGQSWSAEQKLASWFPGSDSISLNSTEQSRNFNQRFYSDREATAGSDITRAMWHIASLASQTGHDAVSAGRGLYNIATDGYARAAAVDGLQDTWNHLPRYAIQGMRSFSDMSLGQKADAAIKFGFDSAISAGAGRLAGIAGGLAYKGGISGLNLVVEGLDDFNGIKIGGMNFLSPIRMYAMEPGPSLGSSAIPTGLRGSGTILADNLGGVGEGYQAHHLVMSSLARDSEALQYLAERGLYDINQVSNGLALPGNQFLALADELPVHTGYHGPEYRIAVADSLDGLDRAFIKGASDANLLNRVGTIERSLADRLLNGELWLNNTDAQLRNLGPYKK